MNPGCKSKIIESDPPLWSSLGFMRMIALTFLSLSLFSLGNELLNPSNAVAGEIHETFIVSHPPTSEQIAHWSNLPGKRSYVIQMGDPTSWELEAIAQLRGADRIRITTTRLPGEDTAATWKSLSGKGVELVGMGAGVPTDDEAERLNRIGMQKLVLALEAYPGIEEARRIGSLKAEVTVVFATRAYPRMVEKAQLLEIPARIPFHFAMDYWPSYTHMDVLNLTPHSKRIRVTDSYPYEGSLPYLLAIKNLEEVTIEAAYGSPDPAIWDKLGELRVSWSTKGQFPAEEGLAAFEKSAGPGRSRTLIVDTDIQLSDRELARLKASPLPIEWIHAAP